MADKYEKLRAVLLERDYPMVYPFKFIIKRDEEKLISIKRIFDETAEITIKASKDGNYTSITIKQMMLSSDDIIRRYELMEDIEDIISL